MYDTMLSYVKNYLKNNNGEESSIGSFPFRKRSDHIERVYMWADRLIESELHIDKDAILTSAIFHDVGYALSSDNSNHALHSAVICEKYLNENGYDKEFINFVTYLVRNHSNKKLMTIKDTPLELIILMEADILDETGAMSVVWDCMMEGSQEIQTFHKTFNHILNYSYKYLNANPMVTDKAKNYWREKQNLMKEFIKQLSFDLGIDNGCFYVEELK